MKFHFVHQFIKSQYLLISLKRFRPLIKYIIVKSTNIISPFIALLLVNAHWNKIFLQSTVRWRKLNFILLRHEEKSYRKIYLENPNRIFFSKTIWEENEKLRGLTFCLTELPFVRMEIILKMWSRIFLLSHSSFYSPSFN